MKRTQIQLPDNLYNAAYAVARKREISMAELVRRGLEYMIAVNPGQQAKTAEKWTLPTAKNLNSNDPFKDPDWRTEIHTERLIAAEDCPEFNVKEKSNS